MFLYGLYLLYGYQNGLAEAQLLLIKSGSNEVKNSLTVGGLSWVLLLSNIFHIKIH